MGLARKVVVWGVCTFSVVAFAFPSKEQGAEVKKQCWESQIMKQLVDAKVENCPAEIIELGPDKRSSKPMKCILKNKSNEKVTEACYSAMYAVWKAIPSFFRPSIKGVE